MALSSIRLQNFRSYKDESFEFEPGVNIIVGPNASGKTNLLEGLLVLARGGSYKARDIEVIQSGKKWARLEGFFESQARIVKIFKEEDRTAKEFIINDKLYKRLSLDKTFPTVLFEPNHLQFISRGPEKRREYIDDLLARSEPGFKSLLASYKRVLAQRNALLKHKPSYVKKQLFAWNIRLSDLGNKIALSRLRLIEDINKSISKDYSSISSQKSKVKLTYDSQLPFDRYASRLLSKLESSLSRDLERGFTSYGPHREDVLFFLNGQPVNQSASRGETRSLVLALKIFELNLIKDARGQTPIFLLDDVFSELDGARRHALVDYLKNQQTIITTTDADAVLAHFSGDHNLIAIGS